MRYKLLINCVIDELRREKDRMDKKHREDKRDAKDEYSQKVGFNILHINPFFYSLEF